MIYQVLAPGPVGVEQLYQGEGHGEGAEEEVRDGQICYEDIARSQHNLGEKNHIRSS